MQDAKREYIETCRRLQEAEAENRRITGNVVTVLITAGAQDRM